LHLLLAACLRIQGDLATAESECRVALAQMPGLAAAHVELARIYRKQKRIGEAALFMAQAQKLRATQKQRRAEKKVEKIYDSSPQTTAAFTDSSAPAFERWD